MGMAQTPVTRYLDHLGVEYRVKPHKEAALTSEAAAQQRGVRLSQIAKCMVGAKADGTLVAMLLPGDRTLKIKKVRQALGGVGVELIPPDLLGERYQLTVGAISPTQLVEHRAIFLVDPTLLEEEWVDIGSGEPLAGVELRARELCDLLGGRVVDIKSSNS